VTLQRIIDCLQAESAAAGLRLVVLHGSRARGDAGPASDWDIGVLARDETPDLAALTTVLTALLGTEGVDVVDLRRASALLRYRAARDGVPLLERPAGEFQQFQLDATQFWCDAGPVIRAAHDDVLAALG
jgi:predicted nucleotidyltransferase